MPPVAGDTQLQTQVLESLSDARKYRRWLADLARPHLGEHPIEVGSGNGDYAEEWAPSVVSLTATEADDQRCAALAERFRDHPVVRTKPLRLDQTTVADRAADRDAPPRHTAAVAFNVLEHIADDAGALRAMGRLVEPGGAVVLVVPAFPSAMSAFDRAIGHYRRYTRRSLSDALRAAGLSIEELRYINPAGLLSWYVAVKALGIPPRDGALLRVYDRTIVPLARLVDSARLPFGQSVFAVARVP